MEKVSSASTSLVIAVGAVLTVLAEEAVAVADAAVAVVEAVADAAAAAAPVGRTADSREADKATPHDSADPPKSYGGRRHRNHSGYYVLHRPVPRAANRYRADRDPRPAQSHGPRGARRFPGERFRGERPGEAQWLQTRRPIRQNRRKACRSR